MKKAERLVYFYDIKMTSSSRGFSGPVKKISIRRAFQLIEMVPKEHRTRSASNDSQVFYLADWRREGDLICLLINKSDKLIPDPVFSVPAERKRRTAKKMEKEGQDFSAHAIVKLPKDDQDSALVLIEQCAGLGHGFIEKLLNKIIVEAKKYSQVDYQQLHPDGSLDENGSHKKININHKIEFQGHLSKKLKDDLNNGKISSIELITERDRFVPFDDAGYIVEKHKSIFLTVREDGYLTNNICAWIDNVFKKNKKDYERAKIKFVTKGNVDRTVDMDTADGISQVYVERAKLDGFNVELESSYENFCPQILDEMKKLFDSGGIQLKKTNEVKELFN